MSENFLKEYSTVEYWNERYENDADSFDWFQTFNRINFVFQKHVRKGDKILVVGCGNSTLSEKLYDEGFTTITNIDFSHILIEQLNKRNYNRPGMTYSLMDVTENMNFPDHFFDVIIDKATLDSILCGPDGEKKIPKMICEIYRVLKKGGRFILITYGNEEIRMEYLKNKKYKWNIDVIKLKKMTFVNLPEENKFHHCYVCTKSYKGL